MALFGKKRMKKALGFPDVLFDPMRQKAVLRCSICTGEQVAGFKDLESGRIREVTLIRNDEELQAFMQHYGISEIEKIY